MGSTFGFLTVDSTDPHSIAAWWAKAFGGEIDYEIPGWVQVTLPGFPQLAWIGVPERKSVKNRLHFDLETESLAQEVHRLETLGARVLGEHSAGEYRWRILADPEGNEFCVYAEDKPSR